VKEPTLKGIELDSSIREIQRRGNKDTHLLLGRLSTEPRVRVGIAGGRGRNCAGKLIKKPFSGH